ncbi:hypothetical protein ATO12_17060 [Aquimarina atlantica]|uniref:Uncharacterized protein n=1 Tax=Aquimarina atlantica TaxID=1317122 RepID=A0A023BUK2_9FLAO|nr:hypothetical protein [Aquimarina atlantica]EZH73645.1 hypothetical protein ATO12_17060 [Aquimarina atlantica]
MKFKESPLKFCRDVRFHIQVLNSLLKVDDDNSNDNSEAWLKARNFYHNISKELFYNQVAPIYDLYCKSIGESQHRNIGLTKDGCYITFVGNEPYIFSGDILGIARVTKGMNLDRFSIKINLGMLYIISEISILMGAVILNKTNFSELANYINKMKDFIKENSDLEYENVNQTSPDMNIEYDKGKRYRTINTASIIDAIGLHLEGSWNDEDLNFISCLRNIIISFIVGHEFGHIMLNTENLQGVSFREQETAVKSFMNENNLPNINKSFLEEFICDSFGSKLSQYYVMHYYFDNEISRLVNKLNISNHLKNHVRFAPASSSILLSRIASKSFLLSFSLFTDNHIKSTIHPNFSLRSEFLKYDMSNAGIPDDFINVGQEIDELCQTLTLRN